MNMLKINKVSLVDNQFTDEELQTGGLCELNAGASGTKVGKGVWHFVKDGTATCVAAETDIAALPADASCKVEELVLKLTKKVRREIPVAKGQSVIDTGLKGLTAADKKATSTIAETVNVDVVKKESDTDKFGQIKLSPAAPEAGVLVVDLEVTVGEGKASHPSMDPEHKLELKQGEPLHVVLYANAKNLEGAKLNVTDFHTRGSRIGITK